MSKVKNVVLYGGGGYLGHYLASELLSHAYTVISVDRERYNRVPGVFNLVCPGSPFLPLKRLREHMCSETAFIHLACPRNKKGEWLLPDATEALREGLDLAKEVADFPRIFVSSLSIHDDPPSDYGNFKKVAEVAAAAAGFHVIRLGTLLGAQKDLPYRGDLGLHMIAEALAHGVKAWVNSEIQRSVAPVWEAAQTIREMLVNPRDVYSCARGLVAYADIVPDSVDRRMPEADFFTMRGDTIMPGSLVTIFNTLVQLIQEDMTWPI